MLAIEGMTNLELTFSAADDSSENHIDIYKDAPAGQTQLDATEIPRPFGGCFQAQLLFLGHDLHERRTHTNSTKKKVLKSSDSRFMCQVKITKVRPEEFLAAGKTLHRHWHSGSFTCFTVLCFQHLKPAGSMSNGTHSFLARARSALWSLTSQKTMLG